MSEHDLHQGLHGVYRPRVETAQPEERVEVVVQRLRWNNVGAVVVVDQDSKPVGILTDRDVAIRAIGGGRDVEKVTVRDIMSPDPAVLNVDATVQDALDSMVSRGVRRLPIVDRQGALEGVVALDDIVRVLLRDVGPIEKVLRWASPLPPALDL